MRTIDELLNGTMFDESLDTIVMQVASDPIDWERFISHNAMYKDGFVHDRHVVRIGKIVINKTDKVQYSFRGVMRKRREEFSSAKVIINTPYSCKVLMHSVILKDGESLYDRLLNPQMWRFAEGTLSCGGEFLQYKTDTERHEEEEIAIEMAEELIQKEMTEFVPSGNKLVDYRRMKAIKDEAIKRVFREAREEW